MAATSLLARLGLRAALLGSAASLVYAAPIADGNVSNDAHTYAGRTGWYHPTATSMGFVANAVEQVRIDSDVTIGLTGSYAKWYGTDKYFEIYTTSSLAGAAIEASHSSTSGIFAGGGRFYGFVSGGGALIRVFGVTLGGSAVLNADGASISDVYGVSVDVSSGGAAAAGTFTTTRLYGIDLRVDWRNSLGGTHNVGTIYGARVHMTPGCGGGMVVNTTNVYGYFLDMDGTGISTNITNFYGLYLAAPTGTLPTITNRWGVYQADPLASSYFAGPLILANGTVGAPSLTFTTDLNTGLYHPAADTVGVATNGTERLRVYADGGIQMGDSTYGTSPGAEHVMIGGRLLVKAPAIVTTIPLTSIHVIRNTNTGVRLDSYSAAGFPGIQCYRARGTDAAPTAVQADDVLGFIGGYGYGTTAFSNQSRARFSMSASQTWTDAAQGTYASVLTTPNGAVLAVERLRVFNDGGVQIGGVFGASPGSSALSVTGTALFAAGAVGTPSITFIGDPNTGIYASAADEIGFATNGVQRMNITTSSIYCPTLITAANRINISGTGTTDSGISQLYWSSNPAALESTAFRAEAIYYNPSGNSTATVGLCALRTKVVTYTQSTAARTVAGMAGWYEKGDLSIALGVGGSLALTNYYGGYVADLPALAAGVTITNQYGLYLETPSRGSTLNIALYSAGLVHFNAAENHAITRVSGDTTLGATHYTVEVDASGGAVAITLPDSTGSGVNGRVYNIVKVDASANAVNINRSGADTINGATTVAITVQYQARTVQARAATPGYSIL